jgi:hypothetical protein
MIKKTFIFFSFIFKRLDNFPPEITLGAKMPCFDPILATQRRLYVPTEDEQKRNRGCFEARVVGLT